MKKTQILMNKPVYFGLWILELNKTVMYEFCYDYVKPKYDEKAKLCYMDTDSFIVFIKTHDIYKDIAEDVEIRFDTFNYELNSTLPKGRKKKVIGVMIDEFESHEEFVELRARSYSCLTDGGSEYKKGKGRRKCAIKWKFKFEDYKNCLEATQLESKINHLEKKKIEIHSLKQDHEEFIENNQPVLKTQQRLKNEKHNVL